MSECRVLCLKSALRLKRRGEQGQEEAKERAIIAVDVRRFGHVNKDGALGTHTGRNAHEGQSLAVDDIAQTVLLSQGAASVTLGNVAEVVGAPEPPIGDRKTP